MSDIENAVEALNKKGYKAVKVDNAEQAALYVMNLIGADESVGVGGSVTLDQIGMIDKLLERGYTLFSSAVARKLGNNPDEARKNAMSADVF